MDAPRNDGFSDPPLFPALAANPLTFAELSAANRARCDRWHPGFPVDDNWSASDWSNAMAGEAGELAEAVLVLLAQLGAATGNVANTVKKIRRHECGLVGNLNVPIDELRQKAGYELADVELYLDLLAQYLKIDRVPALIEKFNIVSEKQGFPERLEVR